MVYPAYAQSLPEATGVPGVRNVTVLREGDSIPATSFVDQSGHPFTFERLRGEDVVLSFIYTRCRDKNECPLISAKFETLQNALASRPVHLVEVTLDPAFDRPAVLARYGAQFEQRPDRWTLLTGQPERVLDFVAQFGIDPFEDPKVGLIHSERTAIVDKRGVIRYLIDEAGWSTDGVVAELDAIERAPSSPLARLDLALSRAAVAICGSGVAGFSGLADLAVFVLILAAFGWVFYRVGRAIARGI